MPCTKTTTSDGTPRTILGLANSARNAESQPDAARKMQYGTKMANRSARRAIRRTTKLSDWPRTTLTYEIETRIQTETPRPVRWSAWLDHTVSIPTVICLCSAFWILGLFVGTLICAHRAKKLMGVDRRRNCYDEE